MKNRFLFLLVILPFLTFAQSELDDEVFEIRSDSAAIAQQQVQSMMLIREFVIESGYNPITKLMMSEFNAFGQPTYIETSPHFSVDYDDYFASFKVQRRFEYNPQHRLSNYCYNYKKNMHCQQTEYDEAGNMTRFASGYDSTNMTEVRMQWKAGKMVKATFIDPNEKTYHIERSINSAGKIAAYRTSDRYVTYDYVSVGNEEIRTVKTYLKDTLYNVKIQKYTLDKNLITYASILNYKGDTLSLVIVSYDSHGNVTAYESRSYWYKTDEELSFGKAYPPKQAEDSKAHENQTPEVQNKPGKKTQPEIKVEKLAFVNEYSAQNLLIKRFIYSISPKGERTLVAIDRVIYDKDPLLVKPWYVEDENEYGDYGDE